MDGGDAYPVWPAILPNDYREKLKSRTGLRDRLQAYDHAIRLLSNPQRDDVMAALEGENQIAKLLSGENDCIAIDGLPEGVRAEISELFGFAFGLLTDFSVRDTHYSVIYEAAPEKLCPFCGIETFDAPTAPREPLDHYLAKSRYPFAAANLRNLVPMGPKCNTNYKLAKDLLRREDGTRRVAFDPYVKSAVEISLDDSEPFGGSTENTPRWEVSFKPDSPCSTTWDEIFLLKLRYRRDRLDPSFRSWLDLFAKSARRKGVQSEAALIDALRWFEQLQVDAELQGQAFLKAAVFRMLRLKCEGGNQRLLDQLMSLVAPAAALPAAEA